VYFGASAVISRRRSFLRVNDGCRWAESCERVRMHQKRTASLRAVATIALPCPRLAWKRGAHGTAMRLLRRDVDRALGSSRRVRIAYA
jgi:hypothetical protein